MRQSEEITKAFLALVRLGIGHEPGAFCPAAPNAVTPSTSAQNAAAQCPAGKSRVNSTQVCQFQTINWKAIAALAYKQGLSAIVLDGVKALENNGLQEGALLEPELAQKWQKLVARSFETHYADYTKRLGQLAWFYNEHGLKLMVLKGYGLSLNYPIPEHRPCGDIDIYAFGKYQEADALISKELGIKIDNSHHHHTIFNFMGYMVENHYDLVNIHAHKSSAQIEKVLKDLALDDTHTTLVNGQKIYLPTPNLNALFLLRHSLSHFASTNISLRQLLDWGFFVKKYTAQIDWKWLQEVLEAFHMVDFFRCCNYICIKHLGFSSDVFPPLSNRPVPGTPPAQDPLNSEGELASEEISISQRILYDALYPEFAEKEPSGLIARIVFKYRRWKANSWKHRLCYAEGRLSSFFVSAWSHLLKPKSI